MTEFLEFRIDKFIFKVAPDRIYNLDGVWAKLEGQQVRVGLSDYPQQRGGDIAFAEIRPQGTSLEFGEEFAILETIKVNLSLGSPVKGKIVTINPELESRPELINQDPFGEGWLAILNAADWVSDKARLMDALVYFEMIKKQAQEEVG